MRFDPTLSQADLNLEDLAGQLQAGPVKAWSILREGASGTGKSAYARYLAARLGLELVERRGSDLLGPYVGELILVCMVFTNCSPTSTKAWIRSRSQR